MNFFKSVDAVSNIWSNLEIFKEMGRVYSKSTFITNYRELKRLSDQEIYPDSLQKLY